MWVRPVTSNSCQMPKKYCLGMDRYIMRIYMIKRCFWITFLNLLSLLLDITMVTLGVGRWMSFMLVADVVYNGQPFCCFKFSIITTWRRNPINMVNHWLYPWANVFTTFLLCLSHQLLWNTWNNMFTNSKCLKWTEK